MYEFSTDNWTIYFFEDDKPRWLCEGYKTMDEMLNAKLFDGKSFNEIFDEVDIEAYC